MEKNDETCYGVLMSKVFIDTYIYLYKPISLIEGKVDDSLDYNVFVDKLNNSYLLTTDPQSLSEDNELSVAFIIKEDDLLNKYPTLCIADALDEYYDSINNVISIGFYLVDSDRVVLLPFNLKDILLKLNERQLESNESIETEVEFLDNNKNSLSELLEKNNGDDIIAISAEYFKELLGLKTYEQLHAKLEEIYESLQEVYKSFDEPCEPDKIDEYEPYEPNKIDQDEHHYSICDYYKPLTGETIVDMFNYVNDVIITTTNFKEREYIKELIDVYLELCVELDEFKSNPEVLECQEYLSNLIVKYKNFDKLTTIQEIKNNVSNILDQEEENIVKVAFIYNKYIKKRDSLDVPLLQTDCKVEQPKVIDIRDMKKFLDKKIIGQEEAKKDVIQAIVMNQLSDNIEYKNSCLLIGPTGSGKTLIVKTVSEYLNKPMEIIDTTQLTVPGYVGANIEDFLSRLIAKAKGDIHLAEEGIVVLDEIDKKGSDNNSDVSGKGVLNHLLPFIQGTTYDVKYYNKTVQFDSSKLTIFATGAFTNVAKEKDTSKVIGFNANNDEIVEDIKYEKLSISDLEKYGSIPIELLGRFSTITQLSGHTKESLKHILTDSNTNVLSSEKSNLKKLGIELKWTEGYIEKVAEEAIKLKTGARSLKNTVEQSIKQARWEVLENLGIYSAIILTQDTVYDNECCTLVDKDGNFHNLKDIISAKGETKLMVLKK